MEQNREILVGSDNRFDVKHYKVKIIKHKEGVFRYIVGVLSYALFIWLLLIGGTLLLYVADIKIRALKGDNTPPVFNAYVVMSGSMLPSIKIKDIVVTKKIPEEKINVEDVITFISADERFSGITITHRVIEKYYDSTINGYYFKTKGDNNNVSDDALVPYDNILGKVILKVPKLGYLQDLLASKGVLLVVVIIPCLVIFSYDIMKMFKGLGKKTKIIK